MSIFWTILAGAGTFVLGQILLKLFIDPVQELKATIASVAHKLIQYSNIYSNPKPYGDERQLVMSEDLRITSSTLQASMHLIPIYSCLRHVFGLPSKRNIIDASKHLIYIHNGWDGPLGNQGILNCYAAQKARIALDIYIPKEDYMNPEHEKTFIKTKADD